MSEISGKAKHILAQGIKEIIILLPIDKGKNRKEIKGLLMTALADLTSMIMILIIKMKISKAKIK